MNRQELDLMCRWVLALEEEVDRASEPNHRCSFEQEIATGVECVLLSLDGVRQSFG